jgi:hypothetical protein
MLTEGNAAHPVGFVIVMAVFKRPLELGQNFATRK